MDVPTCMWEVRNMDFVVGLPWTRKPNYSIWVIVDRFTKSAHLIPVKSTYAAEYYARIYINEIVSLHGIPLSIISDRGARFTYHFWKTFQKGLGTQVKLSTFFHPQMDGQAERTIQTLEYILRVVLLVSKETCMIIYLWLNSLTNVAIIEHFHGAFWSLLW